MILKFEKYVDFYMKKCNNKRRVFNSIYNIICTIFASVLTPHRLKQSNDDVPQTSEQKGQSLSDVHAGSFIQLKPLV